MRRMNSTIFLYDVTAIKRLKSFEFKLLLNTFLHKIPSPQLYFECAGNDFRCKNEAKFEGDIYGSVD